MDPHEALQRLNSDFTLLKSLMHGVGGHDHKELAVILADLVSAAPPYESEAQGLSRCSGAGASRAACDFMALCTTLELDRALVQQRNAHTFMRGNSTVPLLIDVLGQRCIVPLLQRVAGSVNGGRCSGAEAHEMHEMPSEGPSPPSSGAVTIDGLLNKLVDISSTPRETWYDHTHNDDDAQAMKRSHRSPSPQSDAPPVSFGKGSNGPHLDGATQTQTALEGIGGAIDRLLDLDRTDENGLRANNTEESFADVVAALDGYVNSLWDVVEATVPHWPLCLRWGLCAVSTYAHHDAAAVPVVEVHSMLASVVVLRIVAPYLMGYPSCRHPILSNRVDLFDVDAVAARRRITFLTKLLQKAAYQLPMMQQSCPPQASQPMVGGEKAPEERMADRSSTPSPVPPTPSTRSSGATVSASVVVNRVVERLSQRMCTFWSLLCDSIAVHRRVVEEEAHAAQTRNMGYTMRSYQDPVAGPEQTLRSATMATPRMDRGTGDPVAMTPLSGTTSATFSTTGLWMHSGGGSGSGCASPVSGSPFRRDQLSHEVLALYEFIDRHAMSILSHMNAHASLSSSIHLFRLLNFSHYCHRRLSMRLQLTVPTLPLSSTLSATAAAPSARSDGSTGRPKANSLSSLAATSLKALRDRFGRGDGGRLSTAGKQQSPESKASGADCHGPEDDADNVLKRTMFEELVTHSARCRLQPETLNYSQLYGVLLGNVDNLAMAKIRQDAEEADMLRPAASCDGSRPPSLGRTADANDEPPPEALASALMVLYGDQLTEATHQFALQRDRNAAVLQKSLPQTTRYCNKHCASTLHGGTLDAAAYLCYLLDVVSRSHRATRYVQVLFFPPQEPLKCGCGKEWIKAIFHHIVPRNIAAMVSQIVFAQPPHASNSVVAVGGGGVSSARSIFSSAHAASPPTLFGSDSAVTVASLGATANHPVAVKVCGVKVQTVSDALEHVALGKTTFEGVGAVGAGMTPTQILADRLGQTPFVRMCKVPLTLRDWSILGLEMRQTGGSPSVSVRSRRNSAIKHRPTTPTSNVPSSRSLPPYGDGGTFPDVPDDWNDDQPSLPTTGEAALQGLRGHIWALETQRTVLELIWSVSAAPNEDDVMAVAVPYATLLPFRRKALEWFVTFHRGLVENLVTRQVVTTTTRRAAADPAMQSPSGSARTLRRGASSSSLASACPSPAGTTAFPHVCAQPDALVSHAHMQRTGANHCTWFGFLTEKLHPNDMADFEINYYRALCTAALDGAMPPSSRCAAPVEAAVPSDSLATESSWMLVDEQTELSAVRPPLLQRMCTLSLGHVSIRSLWRMMLYSVSTTASVLLFSPQHRRGDSSEGTKTLWEAWRCAQQRRMDGVLKQPQDAAAKVPQADHGCTTEADDPQAGDGSDCMDNEAMVAAEEMTGTSAVLSAFSSLLNRSATFRPVHGGLSATLLPSSSTTDWTCTDAAMVALQQLARDLVNMAHKRGASELELIQLLVYSTVFLRHTTTTCQPSMASGAASSAFQSTSSQNFDGNGDLDAQLARGMERIITTFARQDFEGRTDGCLSDVCLALTLFGVDALQQMGTNPLPQHNTDLQADACEPQQTALLPFVADARVAGGTASAQQWLSGMPIAVAAVLLPPPPIDAQLWYPC